MSEFKTGRLSYNFVGEWSAGTEYIRDDVVSLNGKSYVCLIGHTADDVFANDLNNILPDSDPPQPQPRWVLMTKGQSFLGDWQTGQQYNVGEIVYYKGSVWICEVAHVSDIFSDERNNWGFVAQHIEYLNDWTSNEDYVNGSVVKYNGVIYRCEISHTSRTLLEEDALNWSVFYNGIDYRGDWEPEIQYRTNDLVKYGASIYRCLETHTSQETVTHENIGNDEVHHQLGFDSGKFQIEFPGFQYDSEWDSQTEYQQGDVVRYGGVLWIAVRQNKDSDPFRLPEDSTIDWIEFSSSLNFKGEWSLTEEYRKGDVVQRGGQVYEAIADVNRNEGASAVSGDEDDDKWKLLIPGLVFAGEWDAGNLYSKGSIVYFLGTAYRCNFEHISDNTNFPGDNANDVDYWDIVIQAGQPGGLQEKGDLLSYGLNRTIVGDGSSEGAIDIPIGENEQFLSTSEALEVFWRHRDKQIDQIFVANTGIDDAGLDRDRGLVPDRPFRTIRYAAEYVEDNFFPTELVKIFVATGDYEEIAPITVPQGTVIMGDELRSTTVRPAKPLDEYQDDYQYVNYYLSELSKFINEVLSNEKIEPTPGNDEPQLLETTTTDVDGTNAILNLVDIYRQYIDATLNNIDNVPQMTGSNELNTNGNISAAGQALLENTRFIETELWARVRQRYDTVDFDRLRVRNDVFALVRGVARDLKYSGNYATIVAAQRYVNAVQGSTTKDLFLVRDTTGIRQMTTRGAEGTLDDPAEGKRYRSVTGGSFVALDPGWGPADERTWIKNRSPYIQGVTTIGTGCVGKRIDGSLHNGGNRSMVSNDFTQVLSDGVGVWVSDGGRTELVSVFTYYCAVGYLAETGGTIRATNGNNSYGRFGSVANGNDPTEIPQNITVFNRNNEAQVKDAFAGGNLDEILVFQYTNAGEQYSSATALIEGAGTFASAEYSDFRDGALFEARIINTTGSGQAGGSGYLVRQGFTQAVNDASSTVKLSSSDSTVDDTLYEGARIIIIAGPGTGQYGYISSYDSPTKETVVRRESDSELGWDHVISGTPLIESFDTTSQYRIEPRIETNHPGFTFETGSFPESSEIRAFRFGTTTAIFENISIGEGSETTEGIPLISAEFTVTRRGLTYELEITEIGAGYAIGDTFTILGNDLDGVSPDNDITVRITEVTDDSTNSIVDFTTDGTGRGGRFVAISNDTAYYSDDGDTWNISSLPFTGNNFSDLVAGGDQFIAVAEGEDRVARSPDGETWQIETLVSRENWISGIYGDNKFVLVSNNSNFVQYSEDGITWQETVIPEDTVSDSTGDSTVSSYTDIVYGKGQFVAVSTSDRATAVSEDGVTWTRNNEAIVDRGSEYFYDFVGLQYGDNRYLAVSSDGVVVYSFDALTWYEGTNLDLAPAEEVIDIRYSQGIFFAIYGETGSFFNTVATTENGLLWRYETIDTQDWSAAEYGYVGNTHKWKVLANNTTVQNTVRTGKQALLRANVRQGQFRNIIIWDPGSGYTEETNVEPIITDSTFTVAVETESRLGDGVLPQPDFINRGSGYRTDTSDITISGDGFADIIPEDNILVVAGVDQIPGVGAQIRIDGILAENEDDSEERELFTAADVTDLGDDGSGNGTRLVRFQINPSLENEYNLEHNTPATLRVRYSQVRITNHDFLDIGTGNFIETGYPGIYAGGNFFTASPENEVLAENGGRVFYVSTDQDGNFRGGDLFAVDQATGVITISAEFFDLGGLSELALGGIRLGGSGTVVREFSTDETFAADSDNVVPTQQAIAEFLASRLSVGGQDIETNNLLAGRVQVGGSENIIDNAAGEYVRITSDTDFTGADEFGNTSHVSGTYVSQQLFLAFNDNAMQSDNMQ